MLSQDGPTNYWTDEEILVLLCSLNRDIKDIRAEFEADKEEGREFALKKLSACVGSGCQPSRVKRKIEHLWKTAGPSTGPYASHSSPSDPIFLHGAWTRTLPSLDALYPDMLEKIALAGRFNIRQVFVIRNSCDIKQLIDLAVTLALTKITIPGVTTSEDGPNLSMKILLSARVVSLTMLQPPSIVRTAHHGNIFGATMIPILCLHPIKIIHARSATPWIISNPNSTARQALN